MSKRASDNPKAKKGSKLPRLPARKKVDTPRPVCDDRERHARDVLDELINRALIEWPASIYCVRTSVVEELIPSKAGKRRDALLDNVDAIMAEVGDQVQDENLKTAREAFTKLVDALRDMNDASETVKERLDSFRFSLGAVGSQ